MKDYKCIQMCWSPLWLPVGIKSETLRNAGWMRVTRTMRFLFLQNLGILSLPVTPKWWHGSSFFSTLFKPSLGMPQNGGSANIAGKGRDSLRLRRCGSAWRPWWCMLFSMLAFKLADKHTNILYIMSYVCLKRSSCLEWADAVHSIRCLQYICTFFEWQESITTTSFCLNKLPQQWLDARSHQKGTIERLLPYVGVRWDGLEGVGELRFTPCFGRFFLVCNEKVCIFHHFPSHCWITCKDREVKAIPKPRNVLQDERPYGELSWSFCCCQLVWCWVDKCLHRKEYDESNRFEYLRFLAVFEQRSETIVVWKMGNWDTYPLMQSDLVAISLTSPWRAVRVSTSPGRKILTNKQKWASCVWNQASSGSLAHPQKIALFLKVWTQYSCPDVGWMCQVGMCQQCSVKAPDTLILTANRELCEQAWPGV